MAARDVREIETIRGPGPLLPCRAVAIRVATTGAFGPRALSRIRSETASLCSRRLPPCRAFETVLAAEHAEPSEVIAAVALELQHDSGFDVSDWAVRRRADGLWQVAVACDDLPLGVAALRCAVELVSAPAPTPPARLRQMAASLSAAAPDTLTLALLRAARERGVPVERLNEGSRFGRHLRFGQGRRQRQAIGTISDSTSTVASSITGSKRHTVLCLQRLGLPVPRQELVGTPGEAAAAAGRLGFPVVVKPDRGSGGKGITAGVADQDELVDAFERARARHAQVVVEEMLPGEDHRLLVFGGRFVAATQRRRASVTGDGRTSVRSLVDRLNADPRRGAPNRADLVTLVIDDAMVALLARQGLATDSVPSAGREVLLRTTSNIKSGGSPVDVTAIIHPDNRALAETAAQALRLDFAGIDLLVPDIARSHLEQRCGIVEVNISPGLDIYGTVEGEQRRIAHAVLDTLFPSGAPAAIPLVLVTAVAIEDARDVARALATSLDAAGLNPLWHDGASVREGDRLFAARVGRPERAAEILVSHPRADVAVLAATEADLLRYGVPWPKLDAAVVVGPQDAAARALLGHAGGHLVAVLDGNIGGALDMMSALAAGALAGEPLATHVTRSQASA